MSDSFQFKNLSEYINCINALTLNLQFMNMNTDDDSVGSIWYRGQNYDYQIIPGIYRQQISTKITEDELSFCEENLINDFYIYSRLNLDDIPDEGWGWLAIMQHHGLPTRLVDWTENALQALYFAIASWDISKDQKPVVYALNPYYFNPDNPTPFIAEGEKLNNWLPETLRFYKNRQFKIVNFYKKEKKLPSNYTPIPIYMPHINQRMKSQMGCFTLHGNYKNGLQEFTREKNTEKYLLKLSLSLDGNGDSESKEILKTTLLKELRSVGINEFSTYCDLDSLSRHLKLIHLPN